MTEDLGADPSPGSPFRQAFDSVMAPGEPAVHFRAARSFNRERPERIEATREWWEITGGKNGLSYPLSSFLLLIHQFDQCVWALMGPKHTVWKTHRPTLVEVTVLAVGELN